MPGLVTEATKHILTDEGIEIPKSEEMGLMPEKEKVKKLNEKAYMELILSMDTDQPGGSIALNIVKGTKKGEYKEGNARLAWINLKRKYAPMMAPSLMRMSELYTNAKLRKGADPDVYITYLEDLRDHLKQMNWVVMDTQFMVKVLNRLMPEYGTQVKLLEKRVDKAGAEALTLEEIREDLSLEYKHFQRARQSNRDKEESRGEMALYAGGQFKGKHRGCRKYGHKVANCPDKKEKDGSRKTNGNKTGEFKGKCFKCHEFGHKASNCPNKGKNNEGGGHEDTAEVALAMMDVGNNCHIFGNNSRSESNGTGRDFGKNRANFSKISTFGDNVIPDDFFDDWSLFESEDDDDTSQEAMANDDPPVKGGKQRCMMCFESSESLDHAWCLEGKGAVEVLDMKADEDKEMGNDDEKPIRMRCLIPKKGDTLLKIKTEE